jgi:hypothetical protein
MSTEELLLVAKIFAYVMGNTSVTLTECDKEATKQLIKRMANQRYDWTPRQKEEFKKFVDLVVN